MSKTVENSQERLKTFIERPERVKGCHAECFIVENVQVHASKTKETLYIELSNVSKNISFT
jgi:hypothetical protein